MFPVLFAAISPQEKKTATVKMWETLIDRESTSEALEKTLEAGADPEDTSSKYGYPPLGYLAFHGDRDTFVPKVKVLLKHGVDINKPLPPSGSTPLSMVSDLGILTDQFVPIIKTFLEDGADPKIADIHGFTPFHHLILGVKHTIHYPAKEREVIRKNVMEAAKLMLDHGADINAKTKQGETPILMAYQAKDKALMGFLMANGATPDRKGYLKARLGKALWYTSLPFLWIAFIGASVLYMLKGEKPE